MKNNLFISYLMLGITFFLFSCGGTSDEELNDKATSISITVNKQTIDLGETLTFSVEDNLSFSRTSQATIYFNNEAISGSSYTPTLDGSFGVRAEYEGLVSPNIVVKVNKVNTLSSLILSINESEVLLGEEVSLAALGNEGSDFTNEATYSVNGTEISGNKFTPSERGFYEITASYDGFNSNKLELLTGFRQKVLIEDYTGTWCGYCPRVARGLELVENQIEAAIPVAIHRGGSDPFNYPANTLEDYLNITGYPTAKLNRKTDWQFPEPSNINQVWGLVASNGKSLVNNIGLSLNSTLSDNTLDIVVNSSLLNKTLNGEKLVVYILENGLIYDQENYTSYYGGQSVIKDFEHNHVLRQVPTDLFGDVFNTSELNSETGIYKKEFSFELTDNIENKDNLDVVAFIVNSSGNVLNVQHAEVGVTKDFD